MSIVKLLRPAAMYLLFLFCFWFAVITTSTTSSSSFDETHMMKEDHVSSVGGNGNAILLTAPSFSRRRRVVMRMMENAKSFFFALADYVPPGKFVSRFDPALEKSQLGIAGRVYRQMISPSSLDCHWWRSELNQTGDAGQILSDSDGDGAVNKSATSCRWSVACASPEKVLCFSITPASVFHLAQYAEAYFVETNSDDINFPSLLPIVQVRPSMFANGALLCLDVTAATLLYDSSGGGQKGFTMNWQCRNVLRRSASIEATFTAVQSAADVFAASEEPSTFATISVTYSNGTVAPNWQNISQLMNWSSPIIVEPPSSSTPEELNNALRRMVAAEDVGGTLESSSARAIRASVTTLPPRTEMDYIDGNYIVSHPLQIWYQVNLSLKLSPSERLSLGGADAPVVAHRWHFHCPAKHYNVRAIIDVRRNKLHSVVQQQRSSAFSTAFYSPAYHQIHGENHDFGIGKLERASDSDDTFETAMTYAGPNHPAVFRLFGLANDSIDLLFRARCERHGRYNCNHLQGTAADAAMQEKVVIPNPIREVPPGFHPVPKGRTTSGFGYPIDEEDGVVSLLMDADIGGYIHSAAMNNGRCRVAFSCQDMGMIPHVLAWQGGPIGYQEANYARWDVATWYDTDDTDERVSLGLNNPGFHFGGVSFSYRNRILQTVTDPTTGKDSGRRRLNVNGGNVHPLSAVAGAKGESIRFQWSRNTGENWAGWATFVTCVQMQVAPNVTVIDLPKEWVKQTDPDVFTALSSSLDSPFDDLPNIDVYRRLPESFSVTWRFQNDHLRYFAPSLRNLTAEMLALPVASSLGLNNGLPSATEASSWAAETSSPWLFETDTSRLVSFAKPRPNGTVWLEYVIRCGPHHAVKMNYSNKALGDLSPIPFVRWVDSAIPLQGERPFVLSVRAWTALGGNDGHHTNFREKAQFVNELEGTGPLVIPGEVKVTMALADQHQLAFDVTFACTRKGKIYPLNERRRSLHAPQAIPLTNRDPIADPTHYLDDFEGDNMISSDPDGARVIYGDPIVYGYGLYLNASSSTSLSIACRPPFSSSATGNLRVAALAEKGLAVATDARSVIFDPYRITGNNIFDGVVTIRDERGRAVWTFDYAPLTSSHRDAFTNSSACRYVVSPTWTMPCVPRLVLPPNKRWSISFAGRAVSAGFGFEAPAYCVDIISDASNRTNADWGGIVAPSPLPTVAEPKKLSVSIDATDVLPQLLQLPLSLGGLRLDDQDDRYFQYNRTASFADADVSGNRLPLFPYVRLIPKHLRRVVSCPVGSGYTAVNITLRNIIGFHEGNFLVLLNGDDGVITMGDIAVKSGYWASFKDAPGEMNDKPQVPFPSLIPYFTAIVRGPVEILATVLTKMSFDLEWFCYALPFPSADADTKEAVVLQPTFSCPEPNGEGPTRHVITGARGVMGSTWLGTQQRELQQFSTIDSLNCTVTIECPAGHEVVVSHLAFPGRPSGGACNTFFIAFRDADNADRSNYLLFKSLVGSCAWPANFSSADSLGRLMSTTGQPVQRLDVQWATPSIDNVNIGNWSFEWRCCDSQSIVGLGASAFRASQCFYSFATCPGEGGDRMVPGTDEGTFCTTCKAGYVPSLTGVPPCVPDNLACTSTGGGSTSNTAHCDDGFTVPGSSEGSEIASSELHYEARCSCGRCTDPMRDPAKNCSECKWGAVMNGSSCVLDAIALMPTKTATATATTTETMTTATETPTAAVTLTGTSTTTATGTATAASSSQSTTTTTRAPLITSDVNGTTPQPSLSSTDGGSSVDATSSTTPTVTTTATVSTTVVPTREAYPTAVVAPDGAAILSTGDWKPMQTLTATAATPTDSGVTPVSTDGLAAVLKPAGLVQVAPSRAVSAPWVPGLPQLHRIRISFSDPTRRSINPVFSWSPKDPQCAITVVALAPSLLLREAATKSAAKIRSATGPNPPSSASLASSSSSANLSLPLDIETENFLALLTMTPPSISSPAVNNLLDMFSARVDVSVRQFFVATVSAGGSSSASSSAADLILDVETQFKNDPYTDALFSLVGRIDLTLATSTTDTNGGESPRQPSDILASLLFDATSLTAYRDAAASNGHNGSRPLGKVANASLSISMTLAIAADCVTATSNNTAAERWRVAAPLYVGAAAPPLLPPAAAGTSSSVVSVDASGGDGYGAPLHLLMATTPLLPDPLASPQVIQSASGLAASATSVSSVASGGGGGGGAANVARSRSLLSLEANGCSADLERPDWLTSPLQLSISSDVTRWQVGAVVGNYLFMLMFWAALTLVTYVVARVRRQRRAFRGAPSAASAVIAEAYDDVERRTAKRHDDWNKKKTSPSDRKWKTMSSLFSPPSSSHADVNDDDDEAAATDVTAFPVDPTLPLTRQEWCAAARWTRYPGLTMFPVMMFLQDTVTMGMLTIIHSTMTANKVVAGLSLAIPLALMAMNVYVIVVRKHRFAARFVFKVRRSFLRVVLFGQGEWEDEDDERKDAGGGRESPAATSHAAVTTGGGGGDGDDDVEGLLHQKRRKHRHDDHGKLRVGNRVHLVAHQFRTEDQRSPQLDFPSSSSSSSDSEVLTAARKTATSNAGRSAAPLSSASSSSLFGFFLGFHKTHAVETFFTHRYGLFFGAYRPGRKWYLSIEILMSLVMGIVSGCYPIDSSSCDGLKWGVVGIFAANFMVPTLIFRPFAAPLDAFSVDVVGFLQLASAVFLIWNIQTGLTTRVALASLFVQSLKSLFDLGFLVYDFACDPPEEPDMPDPSLKKHDKQRRRRDMETSSQSASPLGGQSTYLIPGPSGMEWEAVRRQRRALMDAENGGAGVYREHLGGSSNGSGGIDHHGASSTSWPPAAWATRGSQQRDVYGEGSRGMGGMLAVPLLLGDYPQSAGGSSSSTAVPISVLRARLEAQLGVVGGGYEGMDRRRFSHDWAGSD